MKPRNRYRLLLWISVGSGILNLLYAAWILRHAATRNVIHVNYAEPAPVDMVAVSNLLERLSVPLQLPGSPGSSDPVVSPGSPDPAAAPRLPPVQLPFRYSVVQGRRYARIFEEIYTVGELCSYGRISAIFPDRILLDSGLVIYNNGRGVICDESRAIQ